MDQRARSGNAESRAPGHKSLDLQDLSTRGASAKARKAQEGQCRQIPLSVAGSKAFLVCMIVFAVMSKQQPTESLPGAYHGVLWLRYTLWCAHQQTGANRGVSQPCCQDLHQLWLPFFWYPGPSHPWFHQPGAGGRAIERRDRMETHHP